jgi:predicted nucleic acid-binding protein
MATWFIDTGFAIALCVRRDKFHTKAALLASEIERNATQLVTTYAVLLEIGAALSKLDIRADSATLSDLCSQTRLCKYYRVMPCA